MTSRIYFYIVQGKFQEVELHRKTYVCIYMHKYIHTYTVLLNIVKSTTLSKNCDNLPSRQQGMSKSRQQFITSFRGFR